MKRRNFIRNSSIASSALFAINTIYPNSNFYNKFLKNIKQNYKSLNTSCHSKILNSRKEAHIC